MTPGLTSAVASPVKNGLDYYEYKGNDASRETEGTFQTIHWYKLLIQFNWSLARFLSVLTAVQAKLAHLELENSISRRRIWELERELESCQAEVARKRTRVLERECIIAQQREDTAVRARRQKGKERSIHFEEEKLNERRAVREASTRDDREHEMESMKDGERKEAELNDPSPLQCSNTR